MLCTHTYTHTFKNSSVLFSLVTTFTHQTNLVPPVDRQNVWLQQQVAANPEISALGKDVLSGRGMELDSALFFFSLLRLHKKNRPQSSAPSEKAGQDRKGWEIWS